MTVHSQLWQCSHVACEGFNSLSECEMNNITEFNPAHWNGWIFLTCKRKAQTIISRFYLFSHSPPRLEAADGNGGNQSHSAFPK